MSRTVNLFILGLKAFTGLWALITLSVAGALQSKFIGSPSSVGAIIAAGVLTMLWVIVSLVLQFVIPETVAISVLIDTIVFGILFVLALGGTAAESENADFYRRYSRFSEAQLGNAVIGIGWILVFLILAIVVFQVYYTLRHFGTGRQSWLTPFHVLVDEGPTRTSHTTAATNGNATEMSQSTQPVQASHPNQAQAQQQPLATSGQQV